MGKAKIATARKSAGIIGRGDTAPMTKKTRRGERDIDQGDTEKRTTGEVRDTDHGKTKMATRKAISTAHGRTQAPKIVRVIVRGQIAMLHLRTNTTESGMIESTSRATHRRKTQTAVEHTTDQGKNSVTGGIEEHIDNQPSIVS